MNARTNEARLAGLDRSSYDIESNDGTRSAQNALLSEWPGAIFGLLTLGYIVSSLVALL
ncbi:MAG TPA: hypothetical protein VIX59_11275 [Candidatus Binataceae bacterium]